MHCHIEGSICHRIEPFDASALAALRSAVTKLLRFARDERGFDFIAYAEHHNMGDMIRLGLRAGSPWQVIVEEVEAYHADGRFVTLHGYEYQCGTEHNVYLRHPEAHPPLAADWAGMLRRVADGDPDRILAVHNRPNPTDWDFAYHPNFRLIEIVNDGGRFESWSNAGLCRGHRAGFYGGSDDHGGHPGHRAATLVWARDCTRASIWEGLYARRTTAVFDVDADLRFCANTFPQGSELALCSVRRLSVSQTRGPRPLQVILVRNGECLAAIRPDRTPWDWEWEDRSPDSRQTDYYYARAVYPGGGLAVTSPVWFADPEIRPRVRRLHRKRTPSVGMCKRVQAFGRRVGWHKYINGYGLVPRAIRPFAALRDMLIHVGPDALLGLTDRSVVAPTMDGICRFDRNGQSTMLRAWTTDDHQAPRLVTAMVPVAGTIVAGGYLAGEPDVFCLGDQEGPCLEAIAPLRPYLFDTRVITPSWLGSDGECLYILGERELLVRDAVGGVLGRCQDDYPSFPMSVCAVSTGEIYVLSLSGTLQRYDLGAGEWGRTRWSVALPEPCVSMARVAGETWVFNNRFKGCSQQGPVRIYRYRADGTMVGRLQTDLFNIRGVSIAGLPGRQFAAIHNPCQRGSAIYRDSLNESGVLRIYTLCT